MSTEAVINYEALVADLRQEVARVQSELDEATKQGVRAAEYGLAVLEEKNQLQQHCESLESLYDTTKHELECTKNVSIISATNSCGQFNLSLLNSTQRGVGLKSDGTDDGTLSRPRICKPLYGPSQGDETGD